MKVESRPRELALPDAHLDVALAPNGSPVGDVHVFKLVHASAQVAAHAGRVRQRKAASGHSQFAADAAAHISIAGKDGRAALYVTLQADVASADQDTVAHVTPGIHAQRLHPAVDAVA